MGKWSHTAQQYLQAFHIQRKTWTSGRGRDKTVLKWEHPRNEHLNYIDNMQEGKEKEEQLRWLQHWRTWFIKTTTINHVKCRQYCENCPQLILIYGLIKWWEERLKGISRDHLIHLFNPRQLWRVDCVHGPTGLRERFQWEPPQGTEIYHYMMRACSR